MLNYTSLTKIQKRSIDTLVELDPTLKEANTVTRTKLEELFKIAKQNNPKFGYPSFVTKFKAGRGVYFWPGPESRPFIENEDLSEVNVAPKSEEDIQFEQMFMKEMAESGII
jgi:hypothetical protein